MPHTINTVHQNFQIGLINNLDSVEKPHLLGEIAEDISEARGYRYRPPEKL
jgi:hypothetical protein